MDKIAVLIPCYNESKSIEKTIKDYKKAMPDATIYVYDNNSSDGTDEIAKKAGAVVRYEYKQGKGNVVRSMFRDIEAQCYVMTDGDNTYPAKNINKMVDLVFNKNVDMVIGDRLSSTYFTENKRLGHNFGNKLVRFLINKLFKSEVRDIMTGQRAFSYEFVKTFPVLSKGFEIETEMTVHALDKNMSVESVLVDYQDREEGSESKLNTISDGYKVIKTIISLYKNYKPFAFFNIISVFLFIIAAILFIPILIEYINTGLVPRFPTLIVSGFLVIAALQSFFGGLILSTIVLKSKQDFEIKLNIFKEKYNRLRKDK